MYVSNSVVIYSYFMNFFFFEIVLTIPCGIKYCWLGGKMDYAACLVGGPIKNPVLTVFKTVFY